MADRSVTLPVAELIEDLTIYPRHHIDDYHVRDLAEAIRAGAELPPPIVDAASKRIIDGWHRVRAHARLYGPTADVTVLLREYASEADMLADAVRINVSHGRRLERVDQVRSIMMLERAGLQRKEICVILKMTEEKVERLRVRIAYVENRPGHEEPLKRPVLHLRERTLTAEQVAVHSQLGGTSFAYQARLLRMALEASMVNLADNRLRDELARLRAAIDVALSAAA